MRSKSLFITLIGVGGILLLFRLMLPSLLLHYVNKTLNGIPEYQARIETIDVSLWRGAYVIRGLKMIKRGGQDKIPFVDAPRIDIAIEWAALFEGRIVGVIKLIQPTINLVQSSSKQNTQLEAGSGWETQGKKLFPFQINRLIIEQGSITFRELEVPQASDLHLTSVHAELTGITNVATKDQVLPAHIEVSAIVFDSGHLRISGSGELLKDPIGLNANTSLEGVDLTKLNPYAKHHAGFNFQSGTFALYSTLEIKEGKVKGYVKPLFQNIGIINLKDADNPIALAWEAVTATLLEVFTNHSKEQFATVIPLSGSLDDPKADLWSTVVNIIRNAFIQAFRPGFEQPKTS